MGKPKTQDLHQAARRYTVAKQAEQAIEQHNFDKLVAQGLVVAESIDAMIQDVADNGGEYSFITVKGKVEDVHRIKSRGGASRKALPPTGPG